ncbi:Hypothetical protein HDN1F_30260 [gamma proteobacterium HdN1]|nr:Hypothetical protein HDN1F_30260 [gamma proteobacterium HdN1]
MNALLSSTRQLPCLCQALLASLQRYLPGLLLCGLIATTSLSLGHIDWLASHGVGTLTLAIVFGIALGNTLVQANASPNQTAASSTWAASTLSGANAHAGMVFAKQYLLKFGIVLYGFRLTAQDVAKVGATGILIDALVLGSTFALACWFGLRVLGMERRLVMLIGAGSSICGAAAIMATGPVVKARSEQVTIAVSTVVAFGTLAIFLYPAFYAMLPSINFTQDSGFHFGVYIGSTLHEVAQVVATGQSISPEIADAAVVAKMVRVMMLAPFLMGLSLWLARGAERSDDSSTNKVTVPWFAFMFIGVILFNSLQLLSAEVVALFNQLGTVCLAMAMAALGLTTQLSVIRKAGAKPLLLALVLFVWLILGGGLINWAVPVVLA